jgi:hypothetical protein
MSALSASSVAGLTSGRLDVALCPSSASAGRLDAGLPDEQEPG